MISRLIALLIVFLPAARSGPVDSRLSSSAAPEPARELSLAEAVRLALRQNPELAALRKGRAAAEGAIAEARAFADPELRSGQLDWADDGIGARNYNLALRWSPPRWGERGERTRQARSRVEELDAEITAAEQRLAAEVRSLFTEIVFLDEQIREAESAVALRRQMVSLLEAQLEAGAKGVLDRTLAELALADARSAPSALRLERRLRLARLNDRLGLPPGREPALQADRRLFEFEPRSFEVDGLLSRALAARSELAAAAARCEQARSALGLRRRQRYPWFSFLQVSREFGFREVDAAWGFRFGIDLPLFRWRSGMLARPEADLERCQLELEAARRRVALELEEVLAGLRERGAELELYLRETQPAANRVVEVATQAVAAGQAEELERLSAEARRIQHRQAYLDRLLEYRRLEIELDLALGQAIPR
jgi:cobalt-zinc-cadmium efflux system outer membrane protein